MLFDALQTTLAFAPAPEDLDDIHFDAPVIASTPSPADDEESAQGEA